MRGARWGKNGCDWWAIELDYGLGLPLAEVARTHGRAVVTIRQRGRREGWRRDLPDAERMVLVRHVEAATAMRELRRGQLAEAERRLRALGTIIRLTSGATWISGEVTDAEAIAFDREFEQLAGRIRQIAADEDEAARHADADDAGQPSAGVSDQRGAVALPGA